MGKAGSGSGAGEILLISMDNDGTRSGFADQITGYISTAVSIPVIASGGAGHLEHFRDIFWTGRVDAALATSIFNYREIAIPALKEYLCSQQIPVRF